MASWRSLILVLSVIFGISAQGTDKQCYVCASPSLQTRWSLLGLPAIAEQNFKQCTTTSQVLKEACAGSCFTMIFDDPDSGNDGKLYFRGCHTTHLGVVADRSSNGGTSYCEEDQSFPMANSKGTLSHVHFLVEFCNSQGGDPCNTRSDYLNCNQQTQNLLNNQPVSCYDCDPKENSNCEESKCAKKYCMKKTVQLGGGYKVLKSCSNANIYGIDNHCSSNDVITTPGGVAVKSSLTQCFCKDKQYCNSSPGGFGLLSTVFAWIAFKGL